MLRALIILTITFSMMSCARLPSAKSAHSLTKSHFKRYSQKYNESVLGGTLENVAVNSVREQSRFISEIDAVLTYDNGRIARVLITAKKNPPLGWKVVSWEMLGVR